MTEEKSILSHDFNEIVSLLSIAYGMINYEENSQLYYLIGATMTIAMQANSRMEKRIDNKRKKAK